MIEKIDHIGIAVNNIDEAVKLYTDVLGLKVKGMETLAGPKVKTAIITIGESKIELLEATSPESTVAKFIEKRGEGIHHLALTVSNIRDAIDDLKKKGVSLIDEEPRPGVENSRIIFLHPRGTKILLELVES